MNYKMVNLEQEDNKGEIITILLKRIVDIFDEEETIHIDSSAAIQVRQVGELKNHALWLSSDWDWVLGKDLRGEICLVPLCKEGVR